MQIESSQLQDVDSVVYSSLPYDERIHSLYEMRKDAQRITVEAARQKLVNKIDHALDHISDLSPVLKRDIRGAAVTE